MGDPTHEQERQAVSWRAVAIVGLLATLAVAAVWYFTYDFPAASATVGGFIVLFFRELVAVLVLVVVLALFPWRKRKGSTSSTSHSKGDERAS
jgi:uncharacterized membrane protein